ncbi:MAG: DUF5717 family protein, partial [Defluviitaleaceae bacterium]|nr:DUF5717 family protein [Defluviitaleaceae bacterium]
NESAAKLLSQKYSHPDLHRKNCVYHMEARDFSRSAYDIYKAAEDRQVPVPSLPEFLIRAAWKNGFENVSRATMEKYLSSVDVRSDREIGLIAFVYHLILTDPKLSDFIEERQYDILQFGMYSLENGLKGRYFNSIYHFFAKVGGNAVGAEDGHMRQAREILKEAMFLHEVRFETPGSMFTHLYVSEKDRRELGYYSVNNGVAYVRAVDKDFACYCMAAGGQGISGETPYVTPMLENPDKDLLWGFFDDGERMFPLLMSLGRDILAANSETPAAKAIPLLAALLESGELSFSMQNTVNAALGGILHGDGKPERALQYYAKVDENLLDDRYIERMLTVFTGMEQWEKAGRLVMKKAHAVSDRALFRAVRKIAQSAAAQAQRPMIVNAAYELLLKNWYDKKLLELVIGSYPGSQEEWQELSRVLAAMSVTEIGLDEKILENSLWMHKLDAGSQKAFVRMAQNSPENPLTERYAYYCVYEMIANKAKPSYETLLILEKMYDKNKDEILAIGLAHAYLLHDALTFRTEAILAAAIEAQEKMGVLFPIFAGRRDKTGVSAYIEKNRAFLYKGLPGKDMRLYYKAGDDADFRWKRMKYFRFGIYLCAVPQFYGEEIVYYYSETHPTGSISTKEETVRDTGVYINEDSEDPYFTINNALIYEQMFKYDEAEKMAELVVKDGRDVNARII